MALNQLEYHFGQRVTSLPAATRHDFAAITLIVAETSGRVFKNVWLEVTFHGDQTASGITSWLLGVKLGAAAFSDVTVTDDTSYSTDEKAYRLISGNLASYFNSNFGGLQGQNCQVGVQFGGIATQNIAATIHIEYEHARASNNTRTKTVRIPLDGWASYAPTTLTEIGTNQVPKLLVGSGGASLLKEASAAIKNIAIVVESVPATEVVTDCQLALALDAEAEVLDGSHDMATIPAYPYRLVWRRTDADAFWEVAHALKARWVGTGAWLKSKVTLVVTYTYGETATTEVTNHVAIPFRMGRAPDVGRGFAFADVEVDIQEPGAIAMLQSGVVLDFTDRYGTIQLHVKVGTQAARLYSVNHFAGSCTGGLSHRIDAGGVQGAALTLARGRNVIRVMVAIAAGFDGQVWDVSGVLYLNYSSGRAADSALHAHTLSRVALATSTNATWEQNGSGEIDLPSDDPWRLVALGYRAIMHSPNTHAGAELSVETETDRFEMLWLSHVVTWLGVNLGLFMGWVSASHLFRRWSADARPDPTVARDLRAVANGDGGTNPLFWGLCAWWTYHSFSYAVAGNLLGYSGNGAGVTVDVFNASDSLVASVVTTSGGAFSASVYDNTISHYCVARQDSQRKGRSDDGIPGLHTFNVPLGAIEIAAVDSVVTPIVPVDAVEGALDHLAEALARLPQQFQGKANWGKTLTVLCKPIQHLENVLFDCRTKRNVNTATGAQLDVVGRLVGELRRGEPDDEVYRRRIRARIAQKISKGRVEDLIAVTYLLLYDPAAVIVVDQQGTAAVVVRIDNVTVSTTIADLIVEFLRETVSRGVRVLLETSTETTANRFKWDTPGRGWDNAAFYDARD